MCTYILVLHSTWSGHRALGSGELILQNETYNELWRVENSFLRMRRHSAAQKGAASPTMSSGERGTHSSEWEGTPRSAGSGMLIDNPLEWGAMLARPAGRATYHRALGSRELIPQNELRCSEGSGMLIGDPLSEGSNASSTNSELWRAENSFWEGTQHSGVEPKAQAGAWPTQIRARSCARNPTLRDF